MAADPVAGEQATKQGAVQAAGMTVVDVLGHRGLLEAGAAQTGAGLAVVAFVRLAFDQQAQALLEGQGLDIRDAGPARPAPWPCRSDAVGSGVRRWDG